MTTIADIFKKLSEHISLTGEPSFSVSGIVQKITALHQLEFDETGDQLKLIIESSYTDGIDGFEDVKVEGDTVTGIFTDIVSPSLTKRYEFKLTPDNLSYSPINGDEIAAANFEEMEFATAAKKKNCKKGFACGNTCLPLVSRNGTKTKCNYQPVPEQKAVVEAIVKKGKDSPKVSSKSKSPEAKTPKKDSVQPDSLKPVAEVPQLSVSSYSEKTKKELVKLIEVSGKLREKGNNEALAANAAMLFEVYESANSDNFLGIKDAKGNLQSVSVVVPKDDHMYVDYLATSPWNVSEKADKRKTKGAGASAIEAVIEKSVEKGFDGRVKLESLPGAIGFYEKIGFKQVGISENAADGVVQMELTPDKAKEFLKKRGK